MMQSLEDSSLLYKRADGTQAFVHDTLDDYFLALKMGKEGTDVTDFIAQPERKRAVAFHCGMSDDPNTLLETIFNEYMAIGQKSTECKARVTVEPRQRDIHKSINLLVLLGECLLEVRGRDDVDFDITGPAVEMMWLTKEVSRHSNHYHYSMGVSLDQFTSLRSIFLLMGKGNDAVVQAVIDSSVPLDEHLPLVLELGEYNAKTIDFIRGYLGRGGTLARRDNFEPLVAALGRCRSDHAIRLMKGFLDGELFQNTYEYTASYFAASSQTSTLPYILGVLAKKNNPLAAEIIRGCLAEGCGEHDRYYFADHFGMPRSDRANAVVRRRNYSNTVRLVVESFLDDLDLDFRARINKEKPHEEYVAWNEPAG